MLTLGKRPRIKTHVDEAPLRPELHTATVYSRVLLLAAVAGGGASAGGECVAARLGDAQYNQSLELLECVQLRRSKRWFNAFFKGHCHAN